MSAIVGDDCAVQMTADDFLAALAIEVPETQQVVKDHLKDNGQLLLHLLTADLRRSAIDAFASGHPEVLGRLLALIDRALRDGVDDVNNAMAVSFVEDTGWWDPAMQPFIEAWHLGLQAEVDRQRNWRPS